MSFYPLMGKKNRRTEPILISYLETPSRDMSQLRIDETSLISAAHMISVTWMLHELIRIIDLPRNLTSERESAHRIELRDRTLIG